ncbi:MAG: triose-phosphate isomerase [Enterobacteriaceae bacterium]
MTKDFLIIGNWKLNGTKKHVLSFFKKLDKIKDELSNLKIVIAIPIIYTGFVYKRLINSKNIFLSAQNVDTNIYGAFTGEISIKMLKDLNIKYVILGHSERRFFHKETNEIVSEKFFISYKNKITPIICVGENIEEFKMNKSYEVCLSQIKLIIKKFGIKSLRKVVIAYEPIWSIGTGYCANPNHVIKIIKKIKNYIKKNNYEISNSIIYQYGGSVNHNNIIDFLDNKIINGFLIGNASLKFNSFYKIIKKILGKLK